jgi:hypothetical protein
MIFEKGGLISREEFEEEMKKHLEEKRKKIENEKAAIKSKMKRKTKR